MANDSNGSFVMDVQHHDSNPANTQPPVLYPGDPGYVAPQGVIPSATSSRKPGAPHDRGFVRNPTTSPELGGLGGNTYLKPQRITT